MSDQIISCEVDCNENTLHRFRLTPLKAGYVRYRERVQLPVALALAHRNYIDRFSVMRGKRPLLPFGSKP